MPDWDLVRPGDGSVVAYKKDASALGPIVPRPTVNLEVKNSRSTLIYTGPDGSPMTSRALDIAEKIVSRFHKEALLLKRMDWELFM
ncbi:unnamed protein product [Clonostachys rosea]|uniref:Uncharacterized protein n=1 Tax=Bionectria ochroleuca TaxID=29856 RepID=A0ABY6U3B5_BIOOC|nr:unnamed protein product [Clonostachys rosea]